MIFSNSAGETVFLSVKLFGMEEREPRRQLREEFGEASFEIRREYMALASPEP